jgi:HAD superfamily hydrolase (TIGR01509 family)
MLEKSLWKVRLRVPKSVLLFGSIGTIVESSDIQRRAYNLALQEARLDWHWDEAIYRELLLQSGGRDRMAMLGAATGQKLADGMIAQIHTRKTVLACGEIAAIQPPLRSGVAALMALAKAQGWKRGFVTSTEQANIDAITALDAVVAADQFDVIIGRADVEHGKPNPQAFLTALDRLGVVPDNAIAIEDTASSVMAAVRAGITTVAVPGAFASGQDFWQADLVLSSLTDTQGGLDPRLLALICDS